jgi:hypothetical protein
MSLHRVAVLVLSFYSCSIIAIPESSYITEVARLVWLSSYVPGLLLGCKRPNRAPFLFVYPIAHHCKYKIEFY